MSISKYFLIHYLTKLLIAKLINVQIIWIHLLSWVPTFSWIDEPMFNPAYLFQWFCQSCPFCKSIVNFTLLLLKLTKICRKIVHNFRGVSTEHFFNHFLVKYIGINFALII